MCPIDRGNLRNCLSEFTKLLVGIYGIAVGQRKICFLRKPSQEQRGFSFRKLAYHGPKCPDPPYHSHLIFKEFGFMVDSNTIDIVGKTSVDVHGLGVEKCDEALTDGEKVKCNGTKAPFHMVVDLETAEYLDCGVFATNINNCVSRTQCKPHLRGRFKTRYLKGLKLSNYVPEMVLKKGYACLEEKLKSWNIEIITIKELCDSGGWGYSESTEPDLKIGRGDSTVTREEVGNCVLFDHSHHKTLSDEKPLHGTFVLGEFKGKTAKYLLVARFYNQYEKCLNHSVVHQFFNSLISMSENEGRERSRFVGALGRFDSDRHQMFDCLSEHSLTPRKRSGTIILPSITNFNVVYLSSKGIVEQWKHSVPRHGGKLKMSRFTPGFLQNFEIILLPFVECKFWRALLLCDVCALKSVVPRAMNTELENIDRSLDTAKNVFRLQGLDLDTFRETFRFEVLFRYIKLNRLSFNCYPAAQHQDCFQKPQDKSFSGLQNKICLTSQKLYPVFGHVRGGRVSTCRSNWFVFCLLDWASGRRTINKGLVSRRDIMVKYNGNAPLRIMNEVWLEFVYTNAVRLEGGRRAQHLVCHNAEQIQVAQATQDRLMEGEDRVNL